MKEGMILTNNMTTGSPSRHIIHFAMPMLAGMLFQQLYNMVDTMIVGKMLGSSALAAVGSTSSIGFLVLGLCMGLTAGFCIPVAQSFGAGDMHEMRKCVGNSIWLSVGMAAVLTFVTTLLCRSILVWMQTPADILEDAYRYIWAVFLGIPTVILYNLVSGIIRSLGDSRTPVYFLAISSVLNIALDVILIRYTGMGVAGAAWATVIAQGVSGILCLLYVIRKFPELALAADEKRVDMRLCHKLLGMGLPMGLQYSITAIGCAVLQMFLNQLGTSAVAATSAATKVHQLFCIPFDALGSTMATYCGQNVGAGKIDRLKKGITSASLIGIAYSVMVALFMQVFARDFSLWFLDASETEILAKSVTYLKIQSAFYFALTFVNVVRFSIQGMGYSNFAVLAGVIEMLARALVGVLLVPRFGYVAACMGSPAAWIAADMFLLPAAFHCIEKLRHVVPASVLQEKKHHVVHLHRDGVVKG